MHRDLKLENIMLIGKDDYSCKVIDFGFAEKINKEKLVSKAGTPGFLPPEIFKMHPYTDKGDIFSLGIILYCLLTGTSPFKGKTYKEVLDLNRKCAINYESSIWNQTTPDCKECLKSMLDPNPGSRYSAHDVLKCKFINKFYPYDAANYSMLSLKSVRSAKSLKNMKKKISLIVRNIIHINKYIYIQHIKKKCKQKFLK